MKIENAKVFLDTGFIDDMVKRGENFSEVVQKLKEKFELVTDVHALQEVVYRYQLLGNVSLGFERAMEVRHTAAVLPVGAAELDQMDRLMELYPRHTPRELLHVAVMINHGIDEIICAPTSGYSQIEEVKAKHPLTEFSRRY